MARKKLLITLFKGLVSIALISWILSNTELQAIIAGILSADFRLILLALLLAFVGLLIIASRWRLLLMAQAVQVSLGYLLRSCIVAMFFNNFLPSTIGGDLIRAYDSWRIGQNKAGALAVIVIDRFLGLLVLMIFAAIALAFSAEIQAAIPALPFWLGMILAAMLVLAWMIFFPARWVLRLFEAGTVRLPTPLAGPLAKLANAFWAFRGRHRVLASGFGLSILLQTNVVIQYFIIARALDLEVPLSVFFFIAPLNVVIMMIPISINGIGLRETSLAFLFGLLQVPTAAAVAFAWILYALVLIQGVFGGIIYALRR
jgi:uncharacterized protein (TIRG00374 family)